jgi:hypothetical protein
MTAIKYDHFKILMRLLSAEAEIEVDQIISEVPELNAAENWFPLDGRSTNFNVVTNQAMTGGKAATELMTNMVDAVLMKFAYEAGIDPKGADAPKSMREAVECFVQGITTGHLADENERALIEFARKYLVIGITGETYAGLPCYTFADNGEGQDPENFERTFMSLSAGNKAEIPFVQGKYNMGSSGVLSFSGRKWYKLILSRRYNHSGPWGWSLVRRRPQAGVPIAEFFKLEGCIPTFETNYLFPFTTKLGKRYEGFCLTAGTVVKLYDFQIGKGFKSFRGAREAFNENLVESILPFRLLDFRQTPDPKRGGDRALGIDARSFYGMEYLLLRSHAEKNNIRDETVDALTNNKINIAVIDDNELGHIEISAIYLVNGMPSWLQPYRSNNRVFHSVNGQVQFKQTRGFLTQCGMPVLKDRVVLLVDSSGMTTEAHNDIWKGDREHIRETILGERYKSIIKEAIERSDVLKMLQDKAARDEFTSTSKSQRNELFRRLIHSDPIVESLLTGREPSTVLRFSDSNEPSSRFKGAYHPKNFSFNKEVRKLGLELEVNKGVSVSAKTDAENGYLIRDKDRGRLIISDFRIRELFTIQHSLNNGKLALYLSPDPALTKPGDVFKFNVGLIDDSMPTAVTDQLTLRIAEFEKIKPTKIKNSSNKNSPEVGSPTNGGLPPYVLLTKDGRQVGDHPVEKWPDGYSDLEGGFIDDFGDKGVIYKINYDNVYHHRYRMAAKGSLAKDIISEKYVTGMRLTLLGFENSIRQYFADDVGEREQIFLSDHQDDLRRFAARGAASTVLALSEKLPKIASMRIDSA